MGRSTPGSRTVSLRSSSPAATICQARGSPRAKWQAPPSGVRKVFAMPRFVRDVTNLETFRMRLRCSHA